MFPIQNHLQAICVAKRSLIGGGGVCWLLAVGDQTLQRQLAAGGRQDGRYSKNKKADGFVYFRVS